MTKNYSLSGVKSLDKSRVEINASIPTESWESFRKKALENVNQNLSLDGFRKGMVPENIIISKVGEMPILEEMAELAISRAYIGIIADNDIDAIGHPEIRVTKIARGNPLEFQAITAVVPKVDLPDYRKIAAKVAAKRDPNEEKVTDKDIDDAILRLRRMHAPHDHHDHEKMTPEEHEKAIEADMPELTDDFVKSLGDFRDIPDFKNKLSVILAENKKAAATEKTRLAIAEAIAEATKLDVPDVLVESELDRNQAQFQADVEKMGVKMDDYLKHAKKTIEEVRSEWRPHALNKAKLQLILNAIAKAENIKPEKSELDAEISHIIQHYKDADREKAAVYADTVLTNDKVFSFLENQSSKANDSAETAAVSERKV